MKILIVTNNTRTINNFRINLIKHLVKNHDIYIVAKYNEKIYDEVFNNVNFINLNIEEDNFNIFNELSLFLKLYKIIKKTNPDLGIFFTIKPNLYGSIICKLLNIKSVCNIFGLGFSYLSNNYFKKIAFKKILKIITTNSNKIFVQNSYDQKILSKFTNINKLTLLNGSGIDTDYYKNKIDNLDIKYDFTYIGRIIKDKGVDEFVEAAININKIYPNIKFCIQGENYTKRKDRIININNFNYALKNNIITYLDYRDVVKTINQSKWIVLPSYREGSSRILQESISMGKPCLATNVPGCNNIILNNFNGLLFDAKNSKSLEKIIIKSINLSNSDYNLYSENCLKLAKKFDNKNITSFYDAEIKSFSIKNKKLLFIQLNEFTYDIFLKLNKKFNLKNFENFFNDSNNIKTVANVSHNYNEPWIQWYSIFTGLNHKEHKVFSLGESINYNHSQIWENLEKKNLRIASISSMNAVNRLKSKSNVFLPDPWTNTKILASKYDKIFYLLLKKIILDRNKRLKYYIKIFLFLIVSLRYLEIKNYIEFYSIIKNAISKSWSRVFILDYLLTQFYLTKISKKNFNFTSLFLNGLAHNQHHNLRFINSDKQKDNVIFQTYKFYDLIIGKIVERCSQNKTTIFFASGLSQKVVSDEIYYYSFNNQFKEFFLKLNIKIDKFDFLMSRESRIYFKNYNDKKNAIKKLSEIKNDNNINIFSIEDENDTSIKLTISYEKTIDKDFKLMSDNKIILNNFENYVVFWAQKHGEHNTEGTFSVYPLKNEKKYKINNIEVQDLFKFQSSFFN